MATIINTPGNSDNSDNSTGWVVAVIILLVVIIIGAYVWVNYRPNSTAVPNNEPGNGGNVNINLPQVPATNSTPSGN